MRVLFYLGDKQWNGNARAIFVAARGLAARGHPVTVACCAGSELEAQATATGLETVAINSAASAAGGAWDLRKVLRDRFVEVVVVTTERDQLIVSSARMFADRGAVLRRIPSFDGFELQRGGKLALKMAASGVIVSSQRELNDIKGAGWTIAPAVAPLGLEPTLYDDIEGASRADMGAPPSGILIACSYDASGRYRLPTVFRTLSLLAPRHHTNLHVVVFGPDSLDESLRMHASALGVGSLVSFLGDGQDDRIMRAADVGWIVSGSDNAAYACLDFMAMRIPIIADRSPLSQQYVADGINGALLQPGDPSYTASNIAAFLSSRERLTAMGNAGRTRLQRDFSEAAMIDGFEQAANAAGDRTKWTKR